MSLNRKKLLFRNAVFLISFLFFAILILEFGVRIFFGRYLDISRYRLIEGNFEYHNKKDIIRPAPILGYEFIPNAAGIINSLGMMDKERSAQKPLGVFRILFLGDSITVNAGIPFTIEEKLNAYLTSRKYEVWNCAVVGYQVCQYAKYLEYRGRFFSPDLILIGICLNDFSYSYPVVYKTKGGEFFEYYNPMPRLTRFFFNSTLFRFSAAYRLILFKLEKLMTRYELKYQRNFQVTEGLYWLGKIRVISNDMHVPVYIVIYPYLKPLCEYNSDEISQYENICFVLRTLKIDYLDLVREFGNSFEFAGIKQAPHDFFHPNPSGNTIYAEKIYDTLAPIVKKLAIQK